MNSRRAISNSAVNIPCAEHGFASQRSLLNEESFRNMISLERKRSERSRRAFLLMLLDAGISADQKWSGLNDILSTLLISTRETDPIGWYTDHYVVGVMFTELTGDGKSSILSTVLSRVTEALKDNLTIDQFTPIRISCYFFPDDWNHSSFEPLHKVTFYPDLVKRDDARKLLLSIKRLMDLVGSTLGLMLSTPLFLGLSLAVKMSSKGPVFFRQPRVGQNGKPFVLLKFRSMYVNNDSSVHKEYVKGLINGQAVSHPSKGNGRGVYKLTKDSRITRVGAFLRRTSLDELPQLWNVFKGEMSLVGPRPPLAYEVEHYELWHRRRLLEAKPGITGLWQVSGRNRLKFEDMVRLDLMYAKTWTPWLDVRLLLRTPRAVLEGAH